MTEAGDIIVLGIGNELRGDDAAGPLVASAIHQRALARTRAQAVHQLTPEIAEALSRAAVAIFVDAAVNQPEVSVERLNPVAVASFSAHTGDPQALLALADALFGHAPRGYLVRVPAEQFNFGSALSPRTREHVLKAVECVVALVRDELRA